MPRIVTTREPKWLKLMGWISLALIFLAACSSPNTEAPAPDDAHTSFYLLEHAAEADTDLGRCIVCHRDDFQGTGPETDCTICHDAAPSFTLHATPYMDAALHGAAAKSNLLDCFGCHGTSPNLFDGGIVAAPDLFNNPAGNCSAAACHPDAGAHPTRWQGDNDITGGYLASHRTAGRQSTACALCHDYTLGRTAPDQRAPSCFSAGFTNADGVSTGCHLDGGGSAAHDLPYTDPQDHGAAAKSSLVACQACHGTVGTIDFDGGTAPTSCSASECHPAAGAHPTRWQGNNDNTSSYRSTHRNSRNRSTSCSICHDYTFGRTAPNPDAPSCFTGSFTNADGVTTGCHDD